MEVSFKHIVNKLQQFADQHYYLQGNFFSGDEKNLPADQAYPLLLVRTKGMEFPTAEIQFNLDVLVVDKKHDDSDIDKLASDAAYVLEDLKTLFYDNIDAWGFHLESMDNAQLVDGRLSADVIGWYTVAKFRTASTQNEPQLPLTNQFTGEPLPQTAVIMNLFFPVGAATNQTIEVGDQEAGTYHTQTLSNILSAEYTVNRVPVSLPFEIVAGDQLGISITPEDPEQGSKIVLEGEV